MSGHQARRRDDTVRSVGFLSIWGTIFFAITIAISFVIDIPLSAATGLSARSDVVFGLLALISGVAGEAIIRMGLHRRLVLSEKTPIPFLWFWIALSLYVVLFSPFESA